MPHSHSNSLITERVYSLCTDRERTVSARLAADPTLTPGAVAKELFVDSLPAAVEEKLEHVRPHEKAGSKSREYSEADLQRAFECGNWGNTRPSNLFLKCWFDVLVALEKDVLAGVCSPSLMGSSGVIPLTIVSGIPDICRHMANLIVRADKEVFLATNYWLSSYGSALISEAIRELNRRAGEKGERRVVKVMYDRGNVKQVFDNHQPVLSPEWSSDVIKLPKAEEIPNIDMEVVNYHRPMLGTFHAKYMVVDRRIALVQSNNIQDNDNLEMMTQLEGPIVDSFYDMSLLSWHKKLEPPLPQLNSPAAAVTGGSFEQPSFRDLFNPDGTLKNTRVRNANSAGYDIFQKPVVEDAPGLTEPLGNLPDTSTTESKQTHVDALRSASPNPGLDQFSERLPLLTPTDLHWDPDIASEFRRIESDVMPRNGETDVLAISRRLNTTPKSNTQGDAPGYAPGREMTPYIPHTPHEPFPIAMVNRKPYGTPRHDNVHSPQNEAWLSAVRNATQSVFIQTPDLNGEPLIPALVEAAKRGVHCYNYVCLGYNDAGEMLPLQGGTNEMVSHAVYKQLSEAEKQYMHFCWYTAKDMTRPINAKFKQRSCHIKLLIVDRHLIIQGSGNQDTQSWYHSQESNMMADSPLVAEEILHALIERNQNTRQYGEVQKEDGVWRDSRGREVEGSIGVNPGHFTWAKGIIGAVDRVRGKGGF